MPADGMGKRAALKAKLLRRSSKSKSSAKTLSAPHSLDPRPSQTQQHVEVAQNAQNGSKLSLPLHRRRHSQPQVVSLPPPTPSSVATAPVGTRPSTCPLRPKSCINAVPSQHDTDEASQEAELQAKGTPESQVDPKNSTNDQHDVAPRQCPPPAPASGPRPATEPATTATAQISIAPDTGVEAKNSIEPTVADVQITQSVRRGLEEYSFPSPIVKENPPYIGRLSRHSTRSVAATSTRSLNVVDETAPDSFTPPLSQPPPRALPSPNPAGRPSIAVRRQSLVPASQQRLIKTLLDPAQTTNGDYFSRQTPSIQPDMISRKIWVKRAGCSPTLVTVTEEDLVDDLREAILKKYGNSLGRHLDAPDLLLKLIPREPSSKPNHQERLLGPEEPVGRTLDLHYPNGQTVDDALIIEIPPRRTPKPSPRHQVIYQHPEDLPHGELNEYFTPMVVQTPNAPGSVPSSSVHSSHHPQPHSMSVITTGQLPPVPSPGSRSSWHQQSHRPKYPRQHTSSPNAVATVTPSSMNDLTGSQLNGSAPSLPSPAAPNSSVVPSPEQAVKPAGTPPSRVSSPRMHQKQLHKLKKNSSASTAAQSTLPASLLDGTVPPINVLIVEDNTINLKLLEAFMKRLKVRWQTAMNGREAVNKWRQGGFHLVLMDIQLPVMSGLQATREIRRLERVNNIGVFSKTVSDRNPDNAGDGEEEEVKPEDILDNRVQFKSPVIIVALTASSLQSDRHEALAAGCNDFLTKPVNIMWLEQKVTEWGCMQALIDFEGWRKWRGFADITAKSPPTQAKVPADSGLAESPSIIGASQSQSRRSSLTPKASENAKGPLYTLGGKDSSTASSSSTIVPNGGVKGR